MNLLYVSNEYPPETGFGGIGTYTRHAAEGMAARGHSVHVICRSVSGRSESAVLNGVAVHREPPLPYSLPSGRLLFPLRALCYRHIPQTLVRSSWARTVAQTFARLTDENNIRFDLIESPECGAEALLLSRGRLPLVVRLHTPWEMVHHFDRLREPWMDLALQTRHERITTRRALAVSSPSRALADRMAARWRIAPVIYPNPIPIRQYEATNGGGWIYIGRVERRKGVHLLIAAYAKIRNAPPLTLIGRPYGRMSDESDYGDHIRSLIERSGAASRISWLPGLESPAVTSHLMNSSAAFFPSLWENFPYACLEAMACGLAVVAADCGGYPEMIEAESTGILVKGDSADALAGAMRRLCESPGLVSRLGQAARRSVAERYDREIVCAAAERFYESAMIRGRA